MFVKISAQAAIRPVFISTFFVPMLASQAALSGLRVVASFIFTTRSFPRVAHPDGLFQPSKFLLTTLKNTNPTKTMSEITTAFMVVNSLMTGLIQHSFRGRL